MDYINTNKIESWRVFKFQGKYIGMIEIYIRVILTRVQQAYSMNSSNVETLFINFIERDSEKINLNTYMKTGNKSKIKLKDVKNIII